MAPPTSRREGEAHAPFENQRNILAGFSSYFYDAKAFCTNNAARVLEGPRIGT